MELRLARAGDVAELERLMRLSARELSRGFYDAAQIPSVVAHVADLDRTLIDDGCYFVIEAEGAIVACGGWSGRDKLFTGVGEVAGGSRRLDPAAEPARIRAMFVHPEWKRRGLGRRILAASEQAARAAGFTRLELMATLPGEPLYAATGYRVVERVVLALPDGVEVGAARMAKDLAAQ